MGILDSDSDSDCSTSSSEVETTTTKVNVGQFMNKKKASLDDYEAFKGADEEEDEIAMKMKELLQLRQAVGMDNDVNFLAQQAAKEKEKQRLANLTQEERMQEDAAKSGDMMARIRAKQAELSKKKAEEDQKEEDNAVENEMEALKKKKEKKAKKKKKESA